MWWNPVQKKQSSVTTHFCLKEITLSLNAGFWTGNRAVMVDYSVDVYLTAHMGGIKGCEDVRPEQLIAATL